MSERLPRITAAELLRALQRDGGSVHHQTGSHAQLKHPTKPGRVTVPCHRGVTLNPKTLKAALDQAGLTIEDLINLL